MQEKGGFIKKCGLGTIILGAVMALLFIGFAVVMTKVDIQKPTLAPISTTLATVGTAVSGFFAGKIRKKNGLLTGCIVGVVVFAAVLIGFMVISDDSMTINALLKLLAFVISGGAGGLLGVASTNKTKYRAP